MWQRAAQVLLFTTAVAAYQQHGPGAWQPFDDLTGMAYPFTVLLGLTTSFRLSDAFGKWVKASEILHSMSRDCRLAVSRMVAYLDAGEPESADIARTIRRQLILGIYLVKRHVRGESKSKVSTSSFPAGLVSAEEVACFSQVASRSICGNHSDQFPSKNRAAFAFQEAMRNNALLFKRGFYRVPHTFLAVDASIGNLSAAFEEIEHLGTTLLPLPYAQMNRCVSLIFLLALPIAMVADMGWCAAAAATCTFQPPTVFFFIFAVCYARGGAGTWCRSPSWRTSSTSRPTRWRRRWRCRA